MSKISSDNRLKYLITKTQARFRGLITRKKIRSMQINKKSNLMRDESHQRFIPTRSFKIVNINSEI